ncbi:hypothetical protein AB1L42_22810 [Thalassoglobus sp. JC818]|uniref:hypothetical protein n=1 Tax=Thalassoglobus sp. JC818 TaxID=3232136 RepID=UPI00345A90C7
MSPIIPLWYGRKFAFYAMATGREDLVENLNEENLSRRRAEWLRWVSFAGQRLRASTLAWYWSANPNVPIVNTDDPWSGGWIPEFPELTARPATPLPNWEGHLLPLNGDQYLDHS